MKTIKYTPASRVLEEFDEEIRDALYEVLGCSDISFGSDEQLTLCRAKYFWEILEDFAERECWEDRREVLPLLKRLKKQYRTTKWFCMEA